MGLVTKAFTFAPQTLAASAEVNVNFDTLYALVNGNIESDNLAPNAVVADKITDDSVNFNKIDWGTGADQVQGTELTHWRIGQGLANYLDIALPVLTGNRTWTLQDSSDVFVGRDTTDTLTNKTLTSPVVNTGDIDGGTIDGAAINGSAIGGTTPAAGAFTSISGTGLTINSVDIEKALVPIGTIVPIYDFGGALTFDSDYYAYCNGQSKTIGGVSRTLPDLSNRYIVGFGTEGGADIGSAAWATTAVGEASHQVDLSHTHSTDIASFTSGSESSHTHANGSYAVDIASFTSGTGGSHSHNLSNNGWAKIATGLGNVDGENTQFDRVTATSWTCDYVGSLMTPHAASAGSRTVGVGLGGSTEGIAAHSHVINPPSTAVSGTSAAGSSHSHSVNPPATTSTSGGSATQTIQPRSIRVRYLMRIK